MNCNDILCVAEAFAYSFTWNYNNNKFFWNYKRVQYKDLQIVSTEEWHRRER